jgi:hypothetical protein
VPQTKRLSTRLFWQLLRRNPCFSAISPAASASERVISHTRWSGRRSRISRFLEQRKWKQLANHRHLTRWALGWIARRFVIQICNNENTSQSTTLEPYSGILWGNGESSEGPFDGYQFYTGRGKCGMERTWAYLRDMHVFLSNQQFLRQIQTIAVPAFAFKH